MAEEELETIFHHIQEKNNFLLSGGAGSGKTYTLIQVLNNIYKQDPSTQVACITFTNVAVNEIKERAPYKTLKVSTIHDFLWETISSFQKNIKDALVGLVQNGTISYDQGEELEAKLADKEIKYKEWRRINEGVISHEEVIAISDKLFSDHKLLANIVKDKYDYIFIDEFQDTFQEVIDIVLTHLEQSDGDTVVGLFGDRMQSIYRDNEIDEDLTEEVIKKDNRRNPQIIIDLINKIRTDDLVQAKADDENATNYGVQGSANFLYTESDEFDLDELKRTEYFDDFEIDNPNETKELYLVEALIAEKAGFLKLYKIYTKDRIIQYKNRIKREISDQNHDLNEDELTFGKVIELVDKDPTATQRSFIDDNKELFEYAKNFSYSDIAGIYLDKDLLIGEKKGSSPGTSTQKNRDSLIKHLINICECIYLYKEAEYNQFIKKTNYEITSINDKQKLKDSIESLSEMKDNSIEEVIDAADNMGIWPKDDSFYSFKKNSEYRYNRVARVKFEEIMNLYEYVEAYTPYSTQHNIKGAEFDNVFILLDNGGWNNYNFKYLFEKDGTKSVLERTTKLFYVCCSRAKKNLIVFYQKPSEEVLETASEWFGDENIHEVTF